MMRIELSNSEKQAMRSLTNEEREAVIDQLLERAREDIEWVMALERAHSAESDESTRPETSTGGRRRPPPLPRLHVPRNRAFAR
jgi:hypothetical protein